MSLKNRDLLKFVLTIAALSGCGGDDKKKSEDTSKSSDSAVCRRICEKSKAANCENDPSDCAGQCEDLIDGSPARCAAALDAFTSCAAKATFTCDSADESEAKACSKQLDAWVRCRGVGNDSGDAGKSGDGTATGSTSDSDRDKPTSPVPGNPSPSSADPNDIVCTEQPMEGSCGTCAKRECCDSLKACDSECTKRLNCVTACSTQECAEKCLVGAEQAVSLQTVAVFTCLASLCDVECTTSDIPEATEPPRTELPNDCSPAGAVASGTCNVPNKANAYECQKRPFDDCIPSPAGVADIWCCGE